MLDASAVDAAFQPLDSARRLLVAVSGGPDSTALLLLAREWAARRGRPELFAATVDHGLRAEAVDEAEGVAALCARLDVPHATLRWLGGKPETRIQERARDARRGLLTAHAKTVGADMIALGHHADDQAETMLFRMARGSGIAGLAGMAAITARDGMIFARPMLGFPKAALIAHCQATGVAFAQDPSNADPHYARTRLRPLLAALAREGLDAETFARLAMRARRADAALRAAAEDLDARASADDGLDGATLLAAPAETLLRVLTTRLAAAVEGDPRDFNLEAMEGVERRLREALAAGRPFRENIGGAELRAGADGLLRFGRETARRGGV